MLSSNPKTLPLIRTIYLALTMSYAFFLTALSIYLWIFGDLTIFGLEKGSDLSILIEMGVVGLVSTLLAGLVIAVKVNHSPDELLTSSAPSPNGPNIHTQYDFLRTHFAEWLNLSNDYANSYKQPLREVISESMEAAESIVEQTRKLNEDSNDLVDYIEMATADGSRMQEQIEKDTMSLQEIADTLLSSLPLSSKNAKQHARLPSKYTVFLTPQAQSKKLQPKLIY